MFSLLEAGRVLEGLFCLLHQNNWVGFVFYLLLCHKWKNVSHWLWFLTSIASTQNWRTHVRKPPNIFWGLLPALPLSVFTVMKYRISQKNSEVESYSWNAHRKTSCILNHFKVEHNICNLVPCSSMKELKRAMHFNSGNSVLFMSTKAREGLTNAMFRHARSCFLTFSLMCVIV